MLDCLLIFVMKHAMGVRIGHQCTLLDTLEFIFNYTQRAIKLNFVTAFVFKLLLTNEKKTSTT